MAETDFTNHFKSKAHEARLAAATKATFEKLERIAVSGSDDAGILMSMSEAMGTIFGVAAFYKTLGLKRHAELVLKDVAEFVSKP